MFHFIVNNNKALNRNKIENTSEVKKVEENQELKRNKRDVQIFVLSEKILLDNEKNANEKTRKILAQKFRKFKDFGEKVEKIDSR